MPKGSGYGGLTNAPKEKAFIAKGGGKSMGRKSQSGGASSSGRTGGLTNEPQASAFIAKGGMKGKSGSAHEAGGPTLSSRRIGTTKVVNRP